MDYEKAYKEALERATKAKNNASLSNGTLRVLGIIFPELKESEGERIRKEIINTINLSYDGGIAITKETRDKYIAWLEKQGEKKSSDEVLKIRREVYQSGYNDGYKHGIEDEKQRKTKWTEEDEKCIDNCCLLIGAADDCYEKTFKDDCIHYLQSLKKRIAPKPKWTDEDEKRLQSCISTLQGKGLMGGVDTINTKWLKSLKQRML